MTTKKYLVKTMFMNILTAGFIAVAFTACSDDVMTADNTAVENQDVMVDSENGLPVAYGLKFEEFITPNDVEILNADTTEIAVSKAYADMKGISNFVHHPMGIWKGFNETPFLRRATEQKLVGDKYILKVTRASLAEVFAGQGVELNTAIFVNPEAGKTRGGSGDKYTDSRNVIHPMAVQVSRPSDEEGAVTRGGGSETVTLTAEQIMNGEEVFMPKTRGTWDDIKNCIIRFIASGGHLTVDDHGKIATISGFINPKPIKFRAGAGEKDSIEIGAKLPYKVGLDYTLKIDTKLSMKTTNPAKIALNMFTPWNLVDVNTKYFESRLDGEVSVAPEVYIGTTGKIEVPKEQQNYKLCSLGEVKFFFSIGPVPVAIVLQPALYLHFDASVTGRIYTGIEYKYESKFSVGLKYQNKDWQGIGNYETTKSDFNFLTPRATVKGKAAAGIMLGCDVLVDFVAGPTFSVGPMVTGEFNMKIAPADKQPFTFDAALKMGVHGRAGAKLKLWKIQLGEWQQDIVFGPEKTLWSFKFDGKDEKNDGANEKFVKQVNEIKEQTEAEAAKVKAEAEARDKAEAAAMEEWRILFNNLFHDADIQKLANTKIKMRDTGYMVIDSGSQLNYIIEMVRKDFTQKYEHAPSTKEFQMMKVMVMGFINSKY